MVFARMVSIGKSLSTRLTELFIAPDPVSRDEQIETLLDQEASRENVEELVKKLQNRSTPFESVERVPPPEEEPPENRLSRVLRDNYPL